MTARILGLLASLALAWSLSAAPVYVAPDGDDANPGTAARPVATLQAAVDLVADRDTPQEIVLREGVYGGGDDAFSGQWWDSMVTVRARVDPPPLVIRADRRPDGSWADVVLDGSLRITQAEPVPGRPGVFRLPVRSHARDINSLWEEDTRVRYLPAADLESLSRVPASFLLLPDRVYFHTSDGRPPEDHRIGMGLHNHGILVLRRNVTVQGLQLRHFILRRDSSGIRVNVGDVTIEECRVWNARRAFYRGPIRAEISGIPYGQDKHDLRVIRCRADEVGNGVFTYGENTVVEDCAFFFHPGPFEVQDYTQDQSGIQAYHPARGGEMRRNLVVGFNSGLFFKCPASRFVAEFNTIVGTGDSAYGMGCTNWSDDSVFRYNVVSGFNWPLLWTHLAKPGTVVDLNTIWDPDRGDAALRDLVERGIGARNVNADPLFADPENGDFRLRPDSPAAGMGPDGGPIGALGVAGEAPLALPPPVAGSNAGQPADFNREEHIHRGVYDFIPHDGPPRAWYVHPEEGADDPPEATRENPLKTLQAALNRANPGDRVVLLPGIYFGTSTLGHGGTEDAPIVIEAQQPGTAVLDGMRYYDEAILTLRDAPHVHIRGLETRWVKSVQFAARNANIRIVDSPNVVIEDCVFWNDHWAAGRITGYGVMAVDSPGLVMHRNLLYALDRGIQIVRSPGFRLTNNTLTRTPHNGAAFIDSVKGSVFMNNSFTFSGNQHFTIRATEEEMAEFRSDYNNFATYLRSIAPRRPPPEEDVQPPEGDFFRGRTGKAVMSLNGEWFYSLGEWQEATGQDQNSIFAHPRYADPQNIDFRLLPDSPNVGAGEGGADIGARGVVD